MGYRIEGNHVWLTRGDSLYATVSMKRKTDGQPYTPVEGDRVRFALKRNLMDPSRGDFLDKQPLIRKEIPIDTLLLHLAPEDTKGLPFATYVYDLEITFANGDVDTFVENAPFDITREVD